MTTTPTDRTERLLELVETNLGRVRGAEFERLRLAREWALAHVVTDPGMLADPRRRPTPLGAVALAVDDYAAAEFAAALELHPLAGRHWMADAVDIHDRLPQLWTAADIGRVEVWVARKIATATADLSDEQARWVDAAIAEVVTTLPPGRLLDVVAARVVQADQALADRKAEEAAAARMVWTSRTDRAGVRTLVVRGTAAGVGRLAGTIEHLAHLLGEHGEAAQRAQGIDQLRADAAELLASPLAALKLMVGAHDAVQTGQEAVCPERVAAAVRAAGPAATRPRAVLYLHVTPSTLNGVGVTRAEELGVLTRQQLITVLGHHHVTVRPVLDLAAGMAADCYEIPAAIDEQLQLTKPADVFPYAGSRSRKLDRDHTVPYDPEGPPGQTVEANLGKLARHHHRIKTHSEWTVTQTEGEFTWTSPHGRVYVTNRQGTRRQPRPAAQSRSTTCPTSSGDQPPDPARGGSAGEKKRSPR